MVCTQLFFFFLIVFRSAEGGAWTLGESDLNSVIMIQGNARPRRQDEPKPGPEKKKAVKNLAVGFCG